MAEKLEEKGQRTTPYPDKFCIGNKQLSLIFLNWKIQKSKKIATPTQVRTADLFFFICCPWLTKTNLSKNNSNSDSKNKKKDFSKITMSDLFKLALALDCK